MPSKAKAKPCQRRQLALRRPAAQRMVPARRKPAASRRRVQVKSHMRRKRPRGLSYKTKSQRSIGIGVCDKCGEICIHCRAKGIVAIKREAKRQQDDPPTREDSEGAGSAARVKILDRVIE